MRALCATARAAPTGSVRYAAPMQDARSWRREPQATITSATTPNRAVASGAASSSSPAQPQHETAPVIAVNCNGAEGGPVEVAAGAAIAAAQGVRVILFGPAAELGEQPAGVEVVDAPISIAKSADPVSAVRATPEASIVRAARAVA